MTCETTMINRFNPEEGHLLHTRDQALLDRRRSVLGDIYPLFYKTPLHVVRGAGARLYDADGIEYLDAYNNVASVGHGNPRVTEAVSRQLALTNTHTRYLQDGIVEFAERFVDTHPAHLSRVIFTNSGSEANDLALQIARWRTGNRGVLVTTMAYHGTTALLAGVSPENGGDMALDPAVRLIEPPDTYQHGTAAATVFAESIERAADDLRRHGFGVAALLIDTIMSTDGIFPGEPGLLTAGFAAAKAAGALVIADEVQPGMARTGDHWWGFQRHTDDVDMVTCGKPLGGGMPIGSLTLSAELSDGYARGHRYFNTFGGNPASIAAATAVLDEIEERKLMLHAATIGGQLLRSITDLASPLVADVRGAGLFIGVQMHGDDTRSASAITAEVVNGMRERHVLISAVGAGADILKVRPPLVFDDADAELFLGVFADVLRGVETHGVLA